MPRARSRNITRAGVGGVHRRRTRKTGISCWVAGLTGALAAVAGVAVSAQRPASQSARPASLAAAGYSGPVTIRPHHPPAAIGHLAPGRARAAGRARTAATGPWLPRSEPVWLDIPAIGVHSGLLQLGLNPDGTMQVPPLFALPSEAGWYKYSVTPGQIGPSIIVGHVDTYRGPSVFYGLDALQPGDTVDVTLADRTMAIFRVTGVRSYLKADWPWRTVFGPTGYAGLRLITCGGAFDASTGHHLSNIVVFASLAGSRRAASG